MKSHPRGSGHHSVREDKQIEADQLEDVLKEPDDLQSQHILQKEREKVSVCSLQ